MNVLKESESKAYSIFPTPQKITYLNQITKIVEPVNIRIEEGVKANTLEKLYETLKLHQISYSIGNGWVEDRTNIYLADKQNMKEKEGYTLSIKEEPICQISILGKDSEGTHYGVITLKQILEQASKDSLYTCEIVDYPHIMYRGYIEGFYGFPWSHEDRKDLMVFGGEQKFNTYIYAPKDDPYHRKNWRVLYPKEKAKEIEELANFGYYNNVNFVWTIHPGDSIDLASQEDLKATLDKLEQLYTLGVRQFGILFDDIGGEPKGEEQADFINKIDTGFVKAKGDIRPLLTVGTRYCEAWGPSMTTYFKPFMENLHEDVEVMWTGAATMSNISKEQFEAPKRHIQCKKNLSVWWNYPVNDYCDTKLLMGKIENLKTDVDNINGFFSNPMNQAQASKQALFCIADYTWNITGFDSQKSFTASFKALAPEVAEALEIVAMNSCYLSDDGGASGEFLFEESWDIKEEIERLKKEESTENIEKLLAYFIQLEKAVKAIKENCLNRKLVEELQPFLEALAYLADAGQEMMEGVKALKSKTCKKVEMHLQAVRLNLAAMEKCKVLRLKQEGEQYFTVEVGTHLLKPFLEAMLIEVGNKLGIIKKNKRWDKYGMAG